MNKKIMLSESELRGLVFNAVSNILKEGFPDRNSVLDRVEELKENFGAEALLDAIVPKIEERELIEILDRIEYEDWQLHTDDEEELPNEGRLDEPVYDESYN